MAQTSPTSKIWPVTRTSRLQLVTTWAKTKPCCGRSWTGAWTIAPAKSGRGIRLTPNWALRPTSTELALNHNQLTNIFMEITKEQFEQWVANLATKEDVQNAKEEILFRIIDAMATIEEGLGPEERFALFD